MATETLTSPPYQFFKILWPRSNKWSISICYMAESRLTGYKWFPVTSRGLKLAAEYVSELESDAYFTVAVHDETNAPKGKRTNIRGHKLSARLVPGLWVDFDHVKPGQKKKYPPKEDLNEFIKKLPIKPSLIIKTGGGYHAYWLFQEPLEVQPEFALCAQWQGYLNAKLEKLGFQMDTTGDLARILRVPGTIQVKTNTQVRVIWPKSVEGQVKRYQPEQFVEILDQHHSPIKKEKKRSISPVVQGEDLAISADARPPEAFKDIKSDPEFQDIWQRKLDLSDKSSSGWDFRLACYLVGYQWSDQEITDTLIYYRKRHNDAEKLRGDYYQRTVAAARNSSAFRRKPQRLDGIEPYYRSTPVGLKEAEGQLRKKISEFFHDKNKYPSKSLCLRCPAGLGKTEVVMQVLRHFRQYFPLILDYLPCFIIEIYVPTHQLAIEWEKRQRVLSGDSRYVNIKVIMPRTDKYGTNGLEREGYCLKKETAAELERKRIGVFSSLCHYEDMKTNEISECEYYSIGEKGCPYYQQFNFDLDVRPHVRIYQHAHLKFKRNPFEEKINNTTPMLPKIIIIDESYFKSMLEFATLHVDDLDRLDGVGDVIKQALVNEEPLLAALRQWDPGGNKLRAVKIPDNGIPFIYPKMKEWDVERIIGGYQPDNRPYGTLLDVLRKELLTGRDDAYGVTYNTKSQLVSLHWRNDMERVKQTGCGPVLYLDASADYKIHQMFFPESEFYEIQVERQGHVTQVWSTTNPKMQMLPGPGAHADKKDAAKKKIREINILIKREEENGPVLVIGPKALVTVDRQDQTVAPPIRVSKKSSTANFGAIKGRDDLKAHKTVIIISRNHPGEEGLISDVRSLCFDVKEKIQFDAQWISEPRGYRMRDGQLVGTGVMVHPDPYHQRVLEQIRERESEQAIDRLRLLRQPDKKVILLSNLVLDLDVDELITWFDLIYASRLMQAWNDLQSRQYRVMPLRPDWLAVKFADLWKNKYEVENDLKKARLRQGKPLFSVGVREIEYRTHQQSRWSKCLTTVDLKETRRQLANLIGEKVMIKSLE